MTAALAGQPDVPAALRAMALAYMDCARAEPGLARKLDSLAQLPAEVIADDLVDTCRSSDAAGLLSALPEEIVRVRETSEPLTSHAKHNIRHLTTEFPVISLIQRLNSLFRRVGNLAKSVKEFSSL